MSVSRLFPRHCGAGGDLVPASPAGRPAARIASDLGYRPQLRFHGREHGLGQALALEAAAGEFGVGHLGQGLEPRGVCVGFLDHGEEPIEVVSEGMHGGDGAGERTGNQQTEHRKPFNSSDFIGLDIVRNSREIIVSYCMAAIVHRIAQ